MKTLKKRINSMEKKMKRYFSILNSKESLVKKTLIFMLILLTIPSIMLTQSQSNLNGEFVFSHGDGFEVWRDPHVRFPEAQQRQPSIEFSGDTFTLIDYPIEYATDVVSTSWTNRLPLAFVTAQNREEPLLKLNSWQNPWPFHPEEARFRRIFTGTYIVEDNTIELSFSNGTIRALPFSRTTNTVTIANMQFNRKPTTDTADNKASMLVGRWIFESGSSGRNWIQVEEFFKDGTGRFESDNNQGFLWLIDEESLVYINNNSPNRWNLSISENSFTIRHSDGRYATYIRSDGDPRPQTTSLETMMAELNRQKSQLETMRPMLSQSGIREAEAIIQELQAKIDEENQKLEKDLSTPSTTQSSNTVANPKIQHEIVGLWHGVSMGQFVFITFSDDGEYIEEAPLAGIYAEGTYSVNGNSMTITIPGMSRIQYQFSIRNNELHYRYQGIDFQFVRLDTE
ncbi:MAG: hypothetical protein FWG98_00120 [Candidatus Cloacimonetes bacterium]|nr:hypothetical protein [Candidatus Cloacimonadota bacterium]